MALKPKKKSARQLWKIAIAHIEETHPEGLELARKTNAETFDTIKSKKFFREYCFVVYASGFKAVTVQSKFSDLKQAFRKFEIEEVATMTSIDAPLKVIANRRKAQNVVDGAKILHREGFKSFKRRMRRDGIDVLEELPGIGRITKFHLAKNIGLADVAKPDIWLARAAELCGFPSVNDLVHYLQKKTGESIHTIDVALWTLGKDKGFPNRENLDG